MRTQPHSKFCNNFRMSLNFIAISVHHSIAAKIGCSWGDAMSFEVLNDGWFGWDMPAWIDLGNGKPWRQCRVRDLSHRNAKLAVDAHAVPDRFLLRLTKSGSLSLPCRVITRDIAMLEVAVDSR
jgi:hypothetical protein